jgi:hypothetical protein
MLAQRGAASGRNHAPMSVQSPEMVQLAAGQPPLFDIDSFWTASHRAGCSNWHSSIIANMSFPNPFMCGEACSKKTGCAGFNYQPTDCTTTQPGTAVKNACYLFSEPCENEKNVCFDYYELKSPKAKTWALEKPRRGCSNWKSIQMGEYTVEFNENACGLRCTSASGCGFYNFKPDDDECGGNASMGAHAVKGTCILFKGTIAACDKEENDCFDLYKAN